MASSAIPDREWRKDVSGQEYLVATALRNHDVEFINKAFESNDMSWAKRLPEDQIRTMLSQSLTLGLYKVLPSVTGEKTADSPSSPRTPSPTLDSQPSETLQQIGMARFITDYVTFAYLTDVFIEPDKRDLGLGKWLIKCCQEVIESIPALRRAMLLTSKDVGKRFYSRELGFYEVADENHFICMTRKQYSLDAS